MQEGQKNNVLTSSTENLSHANNDQRRIDGSNSEVCSAVELSAKIDSVTYLSQKPLIARSSMSIKMSMPKLTHFLTKSAMQRSVA